jgi:M6 family metalloprotease-like protein
MGRVAKRAWGLTGASLAFLTAIVVLAADPAGAGKLVCTKSAPSGDASRLVASKVFEDAVPRVTAIERARERGGAGEGRTTIRLLAIRVQFQPDSDSRSTGNGTFDYSDWDGATFDGPPHDREYFGLHMTALANYYRSVSYGNLEIQFDVAPEEPREAYTLPHDMGYYHDYSEEQVWYVDQVESFTRDAFAAADTTGSIDFSLYDGYVLFHAGADWQSDVNLDSPFDLPSAHISLGEPILVDGGTVEVWGAAIMPETSSQDGLSIVLNGTLAHEVGHVLGLPDLYNTYNSFPGIGYWGIMDSGGRIGMNTPWGYAYGLIPASPCAWSKEYMAWIEPHVLLADTTGVDVKATVLRGTGERLYRIPLSSDEYYLVENRLDDIGGDNTVVIEQERGVVLGPVDPDCVEEICPVNNEYDFLLPGPGLLVYHVDNTRVIPGLMPYDAVNIDRHRRGVAVEEADGIMDIGDVSSFYWAGSKYDPFFAANNDSFAWNTYPATDNNTGGKTYIALTRISDPDSVMTMNVSFDRWKIGWPIDVGEPLGQASPRVADLDGDGSKEVIVAAPGGNVYAWHADGTAVVVASDPPGLFARAPGGVSRTPAAADLDGDGACEVIVASDAGSLYVWTASDADRSGTADPFSAAYPVPLGGPASAAPIAADLDASPGLEIAAASRGGYLSVLTPAGDHVGSSPYAFGQLILDDVTLAAGDLDLDGVSEIVLSTTNRGWVAAVNADGTPVRGWPAVVGSWTGATVGVLVGDVDRDADRAPEVIAVGSDGDVRVWDRRGEMLPGWPVSLGAPVRARGALADVDGDGYLEIAVPAGASRIFGLRWNGSRVENWPLTLSRGDSLSPIVSSPVLGDIDDDGTVDAVAVGPDGNLFAWNAETGEAVPGWPLSSDAPAGSPWLGDAEGDGEVDLLSAGTEGRVSFYRLPYAFREGNVVWATEGGTASGAASYPDSLLGPEPEATAGLMDPGRTYCYPNPAKRSDLTVRVYLEEPADIDVEIMDVTGQVVKEFDVSGVLTTNEIVWDTSRVASGLYLVHVVVSDPTTSPIVSQRRRESKVMKVGVIR